MTTTKVCILCRCAFDHLQCKKPAENLEQSIISKFYKHIPIFGGEQDNDGLKKRWLSSSSSSILQSFVQSTFEVMSVCQDCLPLLKSTLDRRRMVDDVEESVRRLQVQLLREMELLKNTVNQFYMEMKKIEVLMEDGLSLSPTKTLSSAHMSEISIFEKRIKQVVKDLSTCAYITDNAGAGTLLLDADNKSFDPLVDSSENGMKNDTNQNKTSLLFGSGNDISVRGMNEDSDADNNVSGNDNNTDEYYDPGIMETNEVDSDLSSSSNEEEKQDDHKTDFHQASREKKISIMKNTAKTDTIDLSGMSHFQKAIVEQAVRRKSRILHVGSTSSALPKRNISNPASEYFFDYSVETGTLSLQDVILTINVQDPENEYVECSKCEYRFHASKGQDYYMGAIGKNVLLDHVLGKHLNLFYCQQCDSKFSTGQHYVTHMNVHALSPTCDICGKPFLDLKRLELHKWTHMSKEEAEQAIQSGKKYPRPKTLRKNFQCATCGKSFSSRLHLARHELTHQDRDQRTVMCPVCGKMVLENTFSRSHSTICRPEGEKTEPHVKCLKCPKFFKSMSCMKRHAFRMHSDAANERSHICKTCGKGFKRPWDLKDHLKSHSTERPFECKNGCGSSFKARQACKRHEMFCKV